MPGALMPSYHTPYELEEQAAEQWFWKSGEMHRLNEQYQAIRRANDYRDPARVIAPNIRAYQLARRVFGVPVEIREGVTEAFMEIDL